MVRWCSSCSPARSGGERRARHRRAPPSTRAAVSAPRHRSPWPTGGRAPRVRRGSRPSTSRAPRLRLPAVHHARRRRGLTTAPAPTPTQGRCSVLGRTPEPRPAATGCRMGGGMGGGPARNPRPGEAAHGVEHGGWPPRRSNEGVSPRFGGGRSPAHEPSTASRWLGALRGASSRNRRRRTGPAGGRRACGRHWVRTRWARGLAARAGPAASPHAMGPRPRHRGLAAPGGPMSRRGPWPRGGRRVSAEERSRHH